MASPPQSTRTYRLPPTKLIPNSPFPVIHYRGVFSTSPGIAAKAYKLFSQHGWETQWIYRYGPTQRSHYHSAAHECMAVLTGTATIRFGAADLVDENGEESSEDGGVFVEACAGDVFILPAGTAHKTFNCEPSAEFALLTPGDGHGIATATPRTQNIDNTSAHTTADILQQVELSGFTMLGAYPVDSHWDFRVGGEEHSDFESVWRVEMPPEDPVCGESVDGLRGLWSRNRRVLPKSG